ncbi:Amino acid permease [Bifidobacterium longum subsp. longum]|nr:Amino acid permease [Bifidobacterium longum subsp. longum]TCF19819.1 Amino acid permease [Bifidobacterium longum subsp. longum]
MAAAGTPKDDTGLERKMESRHLTMISLGGVIGTGLFVSSGYTIHQAGPLARSSLTRSAPCSSTV